MAKTYINIKHCGKRFFFEGKKPFKNGKMVDWKNTEYFVYIGAFFGQKTLGLLKRGKV